MERDILRGLTAREFRAWEQYAELEPFDELREDYRTASILQMLYNINRGKKDAAKKLDEFLLKFGESVEEQKQTKQTPAQQLAILKVLAAMHANDVPPIDDTPGQVTAADSVSQAALEAVLDKARKAMN